MAGWFVIVDFVCLVAASSRVISSVSLVHSMYGASSRASVRVREGARVRLRQRAPVGAFISMCVVCVQEFVAARVRI